MLNKRLITQLSGKLDPALRVAPAKLLFWMPLCVTRCSFGHVKLHLAKPRALIGIFSGTTVTIQIVLTGPK